MSTSRLEDGIQCDPGLPGPGKHNTPSDPIRVRLLTVTCLASDRILNFFRAQEPPL